MPIKIHHGANGSYKTSGAVWDDAVLAMKEGRIIITNIRGMSTERCRELFEDLPDSFELVHIDTETQNGLDQARTWFHWAPRGAFLIFDEPQTIFLKKWTDSGLAVFNFPGGPDAAKAADRPVDFIDAWTRHRHWNWDVVLCTPNIKYIRDDIRLTSEMAYLHTNLGVLGKAMKVLLQADYKEVMHSAQDNKPSTDGSCIVKFKKINAKVFKLYDSTATGQHRDTFTGQSLLGSPKLLLPFGIVAIIATVMYYRSGFGFSFGSGGQSPSSTASAPVAASSGSVSSGHPSVAPVAAPAAVSNRSAPQAVLEPEKPKGGPFDALSVVIAAALERDGKYQYLFEFTTDSGSTIAQTHNDLRLAGYRIHQYSSCFAEIEHMFSRTTRTVICKGSKPVASSKSTATAQTQVERGAGRGSLAPLSASKDDLVVVGVRSDGR